MFSLAAIPTGRYFLAADVMLPSVRHPLPLLAIALVLQLSAVDRAWAHAGALPQTIDVFPLPGHEVAEGLETTFGLLLSPDGQEFQWLCHEAITADLVFVTPEYLRNQDGVILAVTGLLSEGLLDPEQSLYRSTDGCSWSGVEGMGGRLVSSAAFHPEDGEVALAVLGATGLEADNGIWRSSDSGLTWADTGVDGGSRLFRDVRFSDRSGSVAWAIAVWFDPLQSWVYRSLDGGVTWEVHTLDFAVGGRVQTTVEVAAASSDGLRVWLRVATATSDYLLASTDGGETFEEVLAVEGLIHDVALAPGDTLWVSTEASGLLRSHDGVNFEPVADAPRTYGIAADDRGLLVAVDIEAHDFALALSADGELFAPLLGVDATVGPWACAPGTRSAEICDPLWPYVAAQLGLGDYPSEVAPWSGLDVAEDGAPSGCGCAGTVSSDSGGRQPRGVGWLTLLLVGLSAGVARRSVAR